jgi:hypothetical protein
MSGAPRTARPAYTAGSNRPLGVAVPLRRVSHNCTDCPWDLAATARVGRCDTQRLTLLTTAIATTILPAGHVDKRLVGEAQVEHDGTKALIIIDVQNGSPETNTLTRR